MEIVNEATLRLKSNDQLRISKNMNVENYIPVYPDRSRRAAVSAEAYDPKEAYDTIIEYEKSNEQIAFLQQAMDGVMFLKNLDEEEKSVILKAMFQKRVKEKDVVIQQGQDGDNFYIIESGIFSVSLSEADDQSEVINTLRDKGWFGELALLYNCPRSATVTADSDGILWGLDQATFKHIVVGAYAQRRSQFENLLHGVPMLQKLTTSERLNLVDALDIRSYGQNDVIIKQGDDAYELFFIMEGTVEIRIKDDKEDDEKAVATAGPGQYFGEVALVMKTERVATVTAKSKVKCAVLHVEAFERLLGPCVDVMERNLDVYDHERGQAGVMAVRRASRNKDNPTILSNGH